MTLRMRLGNASPAISASATQRSPAGAGVCGWKLADIDGKFERKVREHVAHHAGTSAPCHRASPLGSDENAARRRAHRFHRSPATTPSSALPSCRQGALRRPRPHQHIAVRSARATKAAPRRKAPSRFGIRARKRFRVAARARRAAFVPRAKSASRLLRRADGGAEVHHRLGEIAGAALRRQFARQPAQLRLCRRAAARRRQKAARSTRSILPSTGLAGASNAIAAIAAAV